MIRELKTSPFDTLPVVVFHRLHVDKHVPISTHVIVFQNAEDAREKARKIESQTHLQLVAVVDATIAGS